MNIGYLNTEGTSEDLTEKAQRECTCFVGFSPYRQNFIVIVIRRESSPVALAPGEQLLYDQPMPYDLFFPDALKHVDSFRKR